MKYVIGESTLNKVILRYLDKISDDIRTAVAIDVDEETGTEYDDESHLMFYKEPDDYHEENELFHWYGCDYFYDNAPQRVYGTCPVIVVDHPLDDDLSDTFGKDAWQETFKKWFTEKYGLPVTTVEWNRLR